MKTSPTQRGKRGFASYLVVLSTGTILTLLMMAAYRRAAASHSTQSSIQLQSEYSEKEEAVLRSIVAITPNRAIGAMKNSLPVNSWQSIFNDSLELANARTSISDDVKTTLKIANHQSSNGGDSALASQNLIFKTAKLIRTEGELAGYMRSGTILNNTILNPDPGYPPLITTQDGTIIANDSTYPIISDLKLATSFVPGVTPNFDILAYPNINFGYATPGAPFVAKRNWWAFSLNMAANDSARTQLTRPQRDMVLSIYEIPSQLAISANSFMSIGHHASGAIWDSNRVTIEGGIFAGRVNMEEDAALAGISRLAGRRRMDTPNGADPFEQGIREQYQDDHKVNGTFTAAIMPSSLSSESGRVAFIPINRGNEFFDRFANTIETNTLSPTTWNNYSIGALQCAMRLDITGCVGVGNMRPTSLRFSYMTNGGTQRQDMLFPVNGYDEIEDPGAVYPYTRVCAGGESYDFGSNVVNVAFGDLGSNQLSYLKAVTGLITFDNTSFNDNTTGPKSGYFKPSCPFQVKQMGNGKICIAVYPQRFNQYLAFIGADGPAVNNSLVVNVDYTNANLHAPNIPSSTIEANDYGLIIEECENLTAFTRGFSLVSNLRTYIGDSFNTTEYNKITRPPPAGYTPPVGKYWPPCSMFVPEKRYGVSVSPTEVNLEGQIGSLAKLDKVKKTDTDPKMISPLDAKKMDGTTMATNQIRVNLRPITHPAELPPINMMNWLVVLEERRREFIGN